MAVQEVQQEGGEAIELTPHEQEMIQKVDDVEAKAKGLANPDEAPEYKEPEEETTSDDEVDYKAKYEELLKGQQQEPEVKKEPEGLEVPKDNEETSKGNPEAPEETITPEALGKYQAELAEAGSISEESYKELEAKGLSKAVVDAYIQGQQALQEAQTTKVFEAVGGKENYQDMVQWAKESWSNEQIEVFNASVNSGNQSQIMFSVDALKAQYEAAKGSPIPKRTLRGDSQSAPQGSKGYDSKQEMYKAMRNSAYGKDPSYTKMVAEKIALSNF